MKNRSQTAIWIVLGLVVVSILLAKTMQRSQKSSAAGTPGQALLTQAAEAHRPVWLLIHSTTCIPCQKMEEVYDQLKPKYQDKIAFISIIINDPKEQALVDRFQVSIIPTSVFLGPDGKVIRKEIGAVTVEEMEEKLKSLSAGTLAGDSMGLQGF